MSNRFFDPTGLTVIDGTLAQGKNVNQVTDETETAFDLVQGEIDAIEAVALDAYNWANNDQGDEPKPIEAPGEYSAKAYAQEAEAWASGTGGVDTQADGVTTIPYSAAEKAAAALASETAAGVSETNALASETKAEQWATYTGGVVPGTAEYSAKYYAQTCVSEAAAAAGSASAALTSEGLALGYKDDAETAQGLAETARDASITAQGLSEDARDASITAQGLSEDARDASIIAQGLSEDARDAAIIAQTGAETAETNAETAQGLAETAQTAAETAQGLAETAQGLAETAQTGAETAETNAGLAQTAAETAQGLAEAAQTAAETAETNAELAETGAGEAQTAAESARDEAQTARTGAETAQGLAETAQGLAETAQSGAETAYDNFDDRYLGDKASDPTLDNDGDALLTGALYFNTTDDEMRVYDGASWAAAYVPSGGYVLKSDIDDVPVDGVTDAPISSNWAYDHERLAAANPHLNLLSTSATADPNSFSGGIEITNHANGPQGNASYYWILTMEYNSANVAQIGIPYGTEDVPSELWVRNYYGAGSGWQDWVQLQEKDLAVQKDSNTGAANIPVGTVAQRPGTPSAGMLRFNDDDDTFEGYDGTEWGAIGGGGGLTVTAIKTSAYTAEAGELVPCDTATTAAFTVTLPSSPNYGDEVGVLDAVGNASVDNITVDGNGEDFMSIAEDFEIDIDRGSVLFTYLGATQGWVPSKLMGISV